MDDFAAGFPSHDFTDEDAFTLVEVQDAIDRVVERAGVGPAYLVQIGRSRLARNRAVKVLPITIFVPRHLLPQRAAYCVWVDGYDLRFKIVAGDS